MELALDPAEAAFRAELRAWLNANPAGEAPLDDDEQYAWRLDWLRRLQVDRWAASSWPVEYGGRGASPAQQAIFYEELARVGAPMPANHIGIIYVGPTLIALGEEEQRSRYLVPILTGEEVWCQGFSEPEAGSDLAAVKTRAIADGGDWLITGQKIWTSEAQHAKWCIVLARTSAEESKHAGLTCFLVDMGSAGLERRPLRQMTGHEEFNELFFDGVRVPAGSVLGGVGSGWRVALTTLMFERGGIGTFRTVRTRQLLGQLIDAASVDGAFAEPELGIRLAELYVDCELTRLINLRVLTELQSSGRAGSRGSLVKLMWSRTNQSLTELAPEILGEQALMEDSTWAFELLRSRANGIEGGTTEILKNIVAERLLGLPRLR